MEITTAEENKEKRMKRNEDSLRELWDNIKCTNIHIIGVPEGEKREKGPEKIFEEIIAKKFHNMRKETLTKVQKVHGVPYNINPRRNMLRQIIIKLTKIKEKNIKSNTETATNDIQGNPHKIIS